MNHKDTSKKSTTTTKINNNKTAPPKQLSVVKDKTTYNSLVLQGSGSICID